MNIGMMKCPDCEDGYIDATCDKCNGSGEGQADGAVCQFCKGGSNKVACERCDGAGELDIEQEYDNVIMDLEIVKDRLADAIAMVNEILKDKRQDSEEVEAKYFAAELIEHNGEQEYSHNSIIRADTLEEAEEVFRAYAKGFYNDEDVTSPDLDTFEFMDGEIVVEIGTIRPITKEDWLQEQFSLNLLGERQ